MPEIGEDLIKSMQDAAKSIGLHYEGVEPEQLFKNLQCYFKALEKRDYVAEARKCLR